MEAAKHILYSFPPSPSQEQYDAQIANLELNRGRGGVFTDKSRVAISSIGPMAAGEKMSLSFHFKTKKNNDMILVSYGGKFGYKPKDVFLLTLKNGTPVLYLDEDRFLKPRKAMQLNDSDWHHIEISMRSNSCLLSEVQMYVNNVEVLTKVHGDDLNIFFVTSGVLSLGGWGYSDERFGDIYFTNIHNYEGRIDDFRLWHGPAHSKPPTPSMPPTKLSTPGESAPLISNSGLTLRSDTATICTIAAMLLCFFQN